MARRCVWYRNLIYKEPKHQSIVIDERDLLAGGDLITLVYKLRLPASILAYRIIRTLIAD
jgi:hypothetical protein